MPFAKNNKKTVAVAMSGGVDSSVSAIILKKRGFNVIGLSMHLIGDLHNKELNEEPIEKSCCSISDIIDAKRVCVKLGIPHFVINLENEFKENVIDKFTQEYLEGKTPNPCILCNKILKFDILLKRAAQLGANYLATGHYARITKKLNGGFNLIKAKDPLKDQSYVLYNLNQESLSRLIFPVGNLYKTDIRKIALENEFNEISKKKDSVEICFIPDGNYYKFILNQLQAGDNNNADKCDNESCSDKFLNLEKDTGNNNGSGYNSKIINDTYNNNNIINNDIYNHNPKNNNSNNSKNKVLITENNYKGYIKNMAGEIIGKHNGIFQYTVGQRKRLGIASAQPLYVVKIDPPTKDIFVGTMNDCYSDELYINDFNFIDIKYKNKLSEPGLTAKIRYSSLNYKCSAEIINNEISDTINGDKNNNHIIKIKVKFKEPVKFITPGQSAVLYSGLKVIGGGIIEI
ncbi:MAG: MnmA/TRMU family protein [bacterium]